MPVGHTRNILYFLRTNRIILLWRSFLKKLNPKFRCRPTRSCPARFTLVRKSVFLWKLFYQSSFYFYPPKGLRKQYWMWSNCFYLCFNFVLGKVYWTFKKADGICGFWTGWKLEFIASFRFIVKVAARSSHFEMVASCLQKFLIK